jgi:hypothetical protein
MSRVGSGRPVAGTGADGRIRNRIRDPVAGPGTGNPNQSRIFEQRL